VWKVEWTCSKVQARARRGGDWFAEFFRNGRSVAVTCVRKREDLSWRAFRGVALGSESVEEIVELADGPMQFRRSLMDALAAHGGSDNLQQLGGGQGAAFAFLN
jgi:hypothetical protein